METPRISNFECARRLNGTELPDGTDWGVRNTGVASINLLNSYWV